MGLCASTSNANIEEPKKILSSSDKNNNNNNTELLKTNSQLDIGGGAQRATSLTNKPVRTSVAAVTLSFDDIEMVDENNEMNASSEDEDDDDDEDSSSSDDEEIIVDDWLENGPTIEELKKQEEVQRQLTKEKSKENEDKRNRSKWSKFFEQFPREHQTELYNALSYETYYDGDKIVEQGKDGDTFYVITSGKAAITVTDEKQ